jgi:heat shock protein HslJ
MRNSIFVCLAAAAATACSNPSGNNAADANAASGNAAAPTAAPAPTPAANAVAANNVASAAPAAAAPYTASGFEPGWSLSIAGGQMVYQSQNGPNLTVPAPSPQTQPNGDITYITSQLTVTITRSPCQGANEHNYADTVLVSVAGQSLNGCGE